MASIDGTLLDFKRLDELATGATAIHRLDARAKVLATIVFIVSVVSFGRYELTALFPFFLFPVAMAALGDLPARYIARKIVLVLPFAFVVGMFNPLFDREVLVHLGPVGISGGWISCASITIRAILTDRGGGDPGGSDRLSRHLPGTGADGGAPGLCRAAPLPLPLHFRAYRGRITGVPGTGASVMREEGNGDGDLRLPGRSPPAPDLAAGGAHPHGHAGAGLHRRISYRAKRPGSAAGNSSFSPAGRHFSSSCACRTFRSCSGPR